MKLGIYLNSQHPAGDDPARRLAETLEQVRLSARSASISIWAGEHHVTPGFHFFPQLALLQRLAADAEGLWIGTNVTCYRCTIRSSWPRSAPSWTSSAAASSCSASASATGRRSTRSTACR